MSAHGGSRSLRFHDGGSLNHKTKRISIVSLMRDCYVKDLGYKNNKLNAAFNFGGYELMDQTVEENFGIHIDHNVGINFDGFQMVVDKLDGIDITLTQDEADYMELWGFAMGGRRQPYERRRSAGLCPLPLWAPAREANDFGRTYRQRVVVTQVFQETDEPPDHTDHGHPEFCDGCVETDITSNADIMARAYGVYNYGIDDLQAYRLPPGWRVSG